MTFRNYKFRKKQTFVLIATVAVTIATVSMLSEVFGNTSIAQLPELRESVMSATGPTPQQYLDSGGQGVIIISMNTKETDTIRGATVAVPVTVTYKGGINAVPKLTVVADRISGIVLPPSVAKSSTPEERFALTQEGKSIAGALELNPLVRFTPNAIMLTPGESKTVSMDVTIPKTWPDEMVNKGADFSPSFKILEQDGTLRVLIVNDLVTVNVRG